MIQKFLTVLVILMMLVPSVIAAPNEKTNTKDLKITDLSKGTMKEIKDDKVKGMKTSSSDIVVDEKGKNHIKLKDSKPSKDKKEHKKVKVSFSSNELKSIDADNDGKFGIFETANGIVINQYTATSEQLTDGIPMTFSEVEINGFSGYRSETFTGVKSGDVLDITDVSGSDYHITASVSGTVPEYTSIDENNVSTYPQTSNLVAAYPFNSNANDISGHGLHLTPSNIIYSNGAAVFNGINSSMKSTSPTIKNLNSSITILSTINPSAIQTYDVIAQTGYTRIPYGLILDTFGYRFQHTNNSGTYTNVNKNNIITDNTQHCVAATRNSTTIQLYNNGLLKSSKSGIGEISLSNGAFFVGAYSTLGVTADSQWFSGKMYNLAIYNISLSGRNISALYASGDGISFKPSPSYNFTGYNVASGVEKVINTGASTTGLEFIDTTGGTYSVTVKTYYTEDTTVTTETSTDDFYNASVVLCPSVALPNGTIIRSIAPLYTGTAVLDSNNTNAVITQNRTHYTIYTGTLPAGSWTGYNVSVPNNADHGMWLDIVMQWVSGVGWNFVGASPTDYTDDLNDEITVTVS